MRFFHLVIPKTNLYISGFLGFNGFCENWLIPYFCSEKMHNSVFRLSFCIKLRSLNLLTSLMTMAPVFCKYKLTLDQIPPFLESLTQSWSRFQKSYTRPGYLTSDSWLAFSHLGFTIQIHNGFLFSFLKLIYKLTVFYLIQLDY